MNYESILYQSADGIARITLNRPDRLNSFTSAMHAELRDALAQVAADKSARVLLLTGAGRGFCAGQDLSRSRSGARRRSGRPRRVHREQLPSARARIAQPCVAGRVRGQRRRGRRRRQHRARMRHRHRRAIGELHPGVLQDRADPGFRRHVLPAAACRHGARDGPCDARRQAHRRSRRRSGDSSGNASTTRSSHRPSTALLAHLAQAPTRGPGRDQARALRARPAARSKTRSTLERDLQRELGYSADYREGVDAFLATSVRRGSRGK